MSLNQEQEVALELDTEHVVEAAAGSGKTRALVARYLQVLREGRADVDGIVAITFTENAAAEMRERIIKDIDECISKGGEVNFLRGEAIKKLTNAPISTIHGFAHRILQENPLECGLKPDFSLIEGVEEELFVKEVIDEFMLKLWESDHKGEKDVLREVLSEEGFDRNKLREKIIRIISLSRTLHLEQPWKTFSGGESYVQDENALIRNLLTTIEGKLKDSSNNSVQTRIDRIKNLSGQLSITKKKSLKAKLVQGVKKELNDIIHQLNRASKEDKDIANQILNPVNNILNYYDTRLTWIYLSLAEKAYKYLQDRKMESFSLDYEDLLIKARDLLKNNRALRDRYRNKFKFILVDEFQDTDSLQFEIINLLCEGGGANLFIVGDPNQSIFGFRGGDPGVFLGIEDREKRLRRLVKNHRSGKELVDYFNLFFGRLFGQSYVQMKSAKKALPGLRSVEFILTAGAGADEWRREESRRISNRIHELLSTGYQLKDIAILMRSRGYMHIYENALREAGIPYYSASGGGFFSRQEIRDFALFLRYLIYPKDKIAEACVLRSPFLGASDDELLSFYTRKEAVNRISDFRTFVSKLRKESLLLTPLELVERVIEKTGYSSSLLALPDGKAKYVNLNKLIQIVGRMEALGLNITDILDYLESGSEGDSEPLALSEIEGEDSVKILTVHKAKGLEFKVVFLADLNHGSPKGKENIMARRESGFLVRYEGTESSLWEGLAGQESMDRLEEEKRILYVAKTRAKELLIIALGGTKRKSDNKLSLHKETFAGFLDSIIGFPEDCETRDKISLGDIDIPVWKCTGEPKPKPIETSIETLSTSIIVGDIEKIFEKITDPPILRKKDKPRCQKLTGKPSSLAIGTLMHRFLEVWDFKAESIDSTIKFVMNEAFMWDDSLNKELRQLASNFLNSELMDRLKKAEVMFKEVPFYVEINGSPDRGKIDLVLQEREKVSLFDYKHISDRNGIDEFKEQLGRYTAAIERHFGKPPGEKFIVLLPEVRLVRQD
jgi:ATP-dependent helicase/nuclease subunit A